jgi:hypothetical protein
MAEEAPVDQYDTVLDELIDSFPYIVAMAPYAAQMGKNDVKKIRVPTEEGEEEKEFTRDQWNLLTRLYVQRLKWLRRNRIPPRAGKKTAPPPQILYLGKELHDFIVNNKDRFTIVDEELDDQGRVVQVERDPFKGGCLKHLVKDGLALQSTVAGLLRAYNANQKLYEGSTLNKKRAAADEKPNKGIVAADATMKKELAGIFDRLGKYYMETREAREKKKAAKRGKGKATRRAAARVPMTKTEREQGFDPNQFPFGSTLQSITKLGRKYGKDEKDAEFANPKDRLTDAEAKTLETLKEERTENPLYNELLAEEQCTKRKTVEGEEEGEEEEGSDNE